MKKTLILFLLFSKFGFAEQIYFSCERYQVCHNSECSVEPKNFDILLNTKTGEMSDFPISIASHCMDSDSLKVEYSIDEIKATTSCKTDNGTSILILSRRSLKLDTTTTFYRNGMTIFSHFATCKKANKKQF